MKPTLAILALCLLTACAAPSPNGVPNFAWVDASKGICRGGQPTARGFEWLRSQGVTNSVKLNSGSDGTTLTVKAFPVSTWLQIWGGKRLARKLDAAQAAITPGTLVHCQHGKNRTGAVVIAERIRVYGWAKERALAEANPLGWQSSFWGLKAYVRRLFPALPSKQTGPARAAYYDQFRVAIIARDMAESKRSTQIAVTNQMRQSRTNNPNWWIPE